MARYLTMQLLVNVVYGTCVAIGLYLIRIVAQRIEEAPQRQNAFGVLVVLVVADLTAGTGRFNFTQGALATATGIGASLSNLMTGFILSRAGFNVAFLVLAAIAGVALLAYWGLMPETKDDLEEVETAAPA